VDGLAEYADLGILVWSPLAGGYLTGKYSPGRPAPAGTRFAEAGQFVPIDEARGVHVLEALRQVAERHQVSPARVALAWTLSRPHISSVIIAGRSMAHLQDNVQAVDLKLTAEDLAGLDQASDPGVPYPRWMVLQLNQAEDPRPKVLEPSRFQEGGALA
jgi:aryl-alcohol dehydrogenase-like predicted oxidoreductase